MARARADSFLRPPRPRVRMKKTVNYRYIRPDPDIINIVAVTPKMSVDEDPDGDGRFPLTQRQFRGRSSYRGGGWTAGGRQQWRSRLELGFVVRSASWDLGGSTGYAQRGRRRGSRGGIGVPCGGRGRPFNPSFRRGGTRNVGYGGFRRGYQGEPWERGHGEFKGQSQRWDTERWVAERRATSERLLYGTAEATNKATAMSPITIDGIRSLSMLEPEILVKRVDSQLKEFQKIVGNAEIVKPESFNAVVLILSKLVKLASGPEGLEQSMASKVVAEILSAERCEQFHFHLSQAVKKSVYTVQQAEDLCDLFCSMLNRFESLAWDCLPVDELYERVKRLTKGGTIHSALMKKAQEMFETRDQIRISHSEKVLKLKDYDKRDNSEFKLIPVLPEWKEIKEDKGTPPEVRPNKVDTPYKDWMEYYDIQFRLIREDFIAPLRRGVVAFLQGDKGKKNRDVKTYSAAKIVSQVTTKGKGICFVIQFDVSGFRRFNYNWDQSKRLLFGSLLCFIPMGKVDNDTIIFATVADRKVAELQKGEILVQFEGDILEAIAHHKQRTEFEIVESNSYFGAVSPILQSLQRAEVQTMPFTRQLIEMKYDVIPLPVYLSANDDGQPISYNLSCLHGSKRKSKPPLEIEILNKESWEAARDSELDSSQLNAIQTALTQEIAVIQGPPGTGKTYIGLKIVEALLKNRRFWDPSKSCPILVMCYTNHALDQFLEDIIDTECCGRKLEVIRVGGRCKNEKVEAHNLSKMRRNAPGHYGYELSREIGRLTEEMERCNPERVWQSLNRHFKRRTLLPLVVLQHIVHPNHYYELALMPKCAEQREREVEVWLDLWEEMFSEVKEKENKPLRTDSLPSKDTQQNEAGQMNPELSPQEDTELLEIEGEATLVQDDRMIDDDIEGFQRVELPESALDATVRPHQNFSDESESEYYTDDEETDDELGERRVQKPKWIRKIDADTTIRRNLFKSDHMDDEEVEEISHTSIMSLSIRDRWRLYNYWEKQRYKYLHEENRKKCEQYSKKCKELTELKQREDRYILETADVIGMTTTGAAKYQHILHHIKPKIVIVEEAAEVLEAHIVSALSAGTQHLILIGDHKQLRPKPNEYVLATEYKLSISLFERLVMKQMSQATLEIQHRMRPEIAQLVCPHVYEKLLNHESVEKYPDIQGISNNLFFVCHTQPESENPNLMSYQNDFEAKYVVGFCAHLLRLGYSPSQITILTPYVGQLLLIRNKMPRKDFEGVRVTAIDNFQGEENDIILFSMVRSTNPNSSRTTIGFVKEDNRVCVSLSRAKQGFYAIGNFELIRHQSQLWKSIISDVESRGCYGNALPLYCCNHPETKYSAMNDSDFKTNAPNGGCRKMCDVRLPCGHSCSQICHVVDTEHANTVCEKICELTLDCGHTHSVPCYKTNTFTCPTLCSKSTCEREHKCKRQCHYPTSCGHCTETVTIQLPECLHEQRLECYMSINPQKYDYICNRPCEKKLSCGHECPKKCGESCEKYCQEKVTITLTCGHFGMVECYRKAVPIVQLLKYPRIVCKEKCSKTLACGHPCSNICGRVCTTVCLKQVTKQFPCGHKVEYECYKMQDLEMYGLTCRQLSVRRYPCGHSCKIPCSSSIEAHPCKKKCTTVLSCGHKCSGKCGDCYSSRMHAICMFETSLRHYCGYSVTLPCAGLSDSCDHRIHRVPCSHSDDYSNCHKPCSWECKHFRCTKECSEECDRPPCNEPCDKKLRCGHMCPGLCGERCISVCIQCDPNRFAKQFYPKPKQGHLPKNQYFFELGCGHIFTMKSLDEYMKSQEQTVRPKQCPKCHQNINIDNRYGNSVKKALTDVECVKNVMMHSLSIPESEREELCYAKMWLARGLSGPLYALRSSKGFISVKEKLDDDLPVTPEESCFIQCADSFFTLYVSLQSYHVVLDVKSALKTLMKILRASAEKHLQTKHEVKEFPPATKFHIRLSRQILNDFISELYRLALLAQCAIARDQLSEASETEVVGPEHAVASVEQFIQSLNPLKHRISTAQYEEYYGQISSAFPDVANIHVKSPRLPTVVKGTWKKCPSGHYYCLPPVCGAGATRTNDCCPDCH